MTEGSIDDVLAKRADWCVVQGDSLAVLAGLPDACIDAVICDPPYSSGGQFRGDRMQAAKTKYVQSGAEIGSAECADFSGDNRDQRSFSYWCALWMSEARRACSPGAALIAFADWRQLPTTTDAIQLGGWIWRGIVPWTKPSSRPQAGRFNASCEYAVWGTNGPRTPEGDCLPGFYEAMPPRDREHITQKPIDVMRSLCRICPVGGVVLDPFGGSGTTGVAALLEGRRAIICEIVPEHAAMARERMAATVRGVDYRQPAQGGLFS